MTTHARYFINIHNPELARDQPNEGYASHNVQVLRSSTFESLKRQERLAYIGDRHGENYDDLDFAIHFENTTILMFEISSGSDWTFRDPPFSLKSGSECNLRFVNFIRRSAKIAHIEVEGFGSQVENKFEYMIHYLDGNNRPENHDPIINNGSAPPIINPINA